MNSEEYSDVIPYKSKLNHKKWNKCFKLTTLLKKYVQSEISS